MHKTLMEMIIESYEKAKANGESIEILDYIDMDKIPLQKRGGRGVKIDKYIKKN